MGPNVPKSGFRVALAAESLHHLKLPSQKGNQWRAWLDCGTLVFGSCSHIVFMFVWALVRVRVPGAPAGLP